MKVYSLALVSFSLVAGSAAYGAEERVVEIKSGAQTVMAEAQDGELLRVILPFVEKAEPRAEIQEESLVYDDRCEVLDVKNEAPKVEVLLRMPSTVADSGFNGCRVLIDRGFSSDDSDIVQVSYGYEILD